MKRVSKLTFIIGLLASCVGSGQLHAMSYYNSARAWWPYLRKGRIATAVLTPVVLCKIYNMYRWYKGLATTRQICNVSTQPQKVGKAEPSDSSVSVQASPALVSYGYSLKSLEESSKVFQKVGKPSTRKKRTKKRKRRRKKNAWRGHPHNFTDSYMNCLGSLAASGNRI